MDRTCLKCGKVFDMPYMLRKHEANKRPCDRVIEMTEDGEFICPHCDKSYGTKSILARHVRLSCKKAKSDARDDEIMARLEHITEMLSKQIIINNGTIINGGTLNDCTITHGDVAHGDIAHGDIAHGNITHSVTPGWPYKWSEPQNIQFMYPDVNVEFDTLKRAIKAMPIDMLSLCGQGDKQAIEILLVEVVRVLHADPCNRNIVLNPARIDQVFVRIPERWVCIPILKAIKLIQSHIIDSIDDVLKFAPEDIPAVQLVKAQYTSSKPSKETVNEWTTHLQDVTAQCSAMGGDHNWAITKEASNLDINVFEREKHKHIEIKEVVYVILNRLFVDDENGLKECLHRDANGTIHQALVDFWFALIKIPENLTAFINGDHAMVHTANGWERQGIEEVAFKQAKSALMLLSEFCVHNRETETDYISHLGEFIKRGLDEFASNEVRDLTLLKITTKKVQSLCRDSKNKSSFPITFDCI